MLDILLFVKFIEKTNLVDVTNLMCFFISIANFPHLVLNNIAITGPVIKMTKLSEWRLYLLTYWECIAVIFDGSCHCYGAVIGFVSQIAKSSVLDNDREFDCPFNYGATWRTDGGELKKMHERH